MRRSVTKSLTISEFSYAHSTSEMIIKYNENSKEYDLKMPQMTLTAAEMEGLISEISKFIQKMKMPEK